MIERTVLEMKKIIMLTLSCVVIFALTGCGSNTISSSDSTVFNSSVDDELSSGDSSSASFDPSATVFDSSSDNELLSSEDLLSVSPSDTLDTISEIETESVSNILDSAEPTSGDSQEEQSVSSENMTVSDYYKSVLSGQSDFISAFTGETVNIKDIYKEVTEDFTVEAREFGVLFLPDQDYPAVVLSLYVDGNEYGYELLNFYDMTVYGYTFAYREMYDLKTDGSFMFSGGQVDGIASIVFEEKNCFTNKIAYYVSNSATDSIKYFVDREPSEESDYNTAITRWEATTVPVTLYELNEANINSAFIEDK